MVDIRPLLFANALILMLLVAAGFASLQSGTADLSRLGPEIAAWVDTLRGSALEAIEGPATEPEQTLSAAEPSPPPPSPFEDQQLSSRDTTFQNTTSPDTVAQRPVDPAPELADNPRPMENSVTGLIEVDIPSPAELSIDPEILPIEPATAEVAAVTAEVAPVAADVEPEPEPASTTGALILRSNVYGDAVAINGKSYGSTRLDLELEPGKYQIVVSKDGHRAWQDTITLAAGDETRIFAELEPFTVVQYKDGRWRGGLVTGEGTYEDETGLTYTGEFRNREFHGQGRAVYPDGRQYDGEWANGKPDGRGTLRLANGDIYSGGFAAGVYSGEGTLTTADGDIFTGNWARGALNGRGTLTAADGALYVGGFRDGKFHGEGTLTFPDGRHYEGGFADGQFHGKGTLIYSDGKKYEGYFMEGEYHGSGDLLNPNGSRITANFRYGEPYGQVRLTTAEGEVFTARTSEPGVCYRENSYRATQCPPMPGW